MNEMNESVNKLLEEIKKKYTDLNISFSFIKREELLEIWYNNKNYIENENFQEDIYSVAKKYLYDNNIKNYCINYRNRKVKDNNNLIQSDKENNSVNILDLLPETKNNNKDTELLFEKIKGELKYIYTDINIYLNFIKSENIFEIWYNNRNYIKDEKFQNDIYSIAEKHLYNNNIKNYCINYRNRKLKKIDKWFEISTLFIKNLRSNLNIIENLADNNLFMVKNLVDNNLFMIENLVDNNLFMIENLVDSNLVMIENLSIIETLVDENLKINEEISIQKRNNSTKKIEENETLALAA